MKAIEIKARKHFKNVKAGELKPVFSPGLAPSESDLVWVGDSPLPLEVYYNYLAASNRGKARKLVRSPKSLHPHVPTRKKKGAPTTTEDLKPATSRTSEEATYYTQVGSQRATLGGGENATDAD